MIMTTTENAKSHLREIAAKFSDPESQAELTGFIEMSYLRPVGGIPCHAWSAGNRMMTYFSGTSDARGYKQWLAAGRNVKKGAKAIYILGPRIIQAEVKDDKTGEISKEPRVIGFKSIPVFRYEDTEGAKIEYVENEPKEMPPLAEVAEKWGSEITYQGTRDGEYGAYNPRSGKIRLCTDDTSVFFHELAHLAHSRLEDLKPGQDPEQEAVAQLTACTLAKMYGRNIEGHTHEYIAKYAAGTDAAAAGAMCYRVMGKVEKVLEMILDQAAELTAIPAQAK